MTIVTVRCVVCDVMMQWNVDYETAKAGGWKVVQATPKSGPVSKRSYLAMSKSMRTLALDAFSKRNKSRVQFESSTVLQEATVVGKAEVQRLRDDNAVLEKRLRESQQTTNELRHKYETEMFAKFDDMRCQWEQNHNQQLASYEARLSQREQQMHDKDVLITNLNMLLDKRNAEVDRLKTELKGQVAENQKMDSMLQHAIDSKMKSLVQSQTEISKLKLSVQCTVHTLSVPMFCGCGLCSSTMGWLVVFLCLGA